MLVMRVDRLNASNGGVTQTIVSLPCSTNRRNNAPSSVNFFGGCIHENDSAQDPTAYESMS